MKNALNEIQVFARMGTNYFRYKIGRPRPFFCVYFSTLECNYKCRYCPIVVESGSERSKKAQEAKQKSELTTEQAKYVIDWLKKIGTVGLSFSGGEPLLRMDLEEIALNAKEKHFFNVLNTNASLVTEDRAYSLAKCFDSVTVSLAGSPETDNKLRGSQAYERTTAGIQILKKHTKLKVNLNFVVNKENYREIDFVVDYAKEHCDSITFLPISYQSDFLLDDDSAASVQQKIFSFKKKHGHFISNSINYIEFFAIFLTGRTIHFQCDPFVVYFSLGPNGEVCGCCSYPDSVANALEMPPEDYRFLAGKHKKNLLIQCGGCSSPLCWELSALYRRPFYRNIFMANKYFDLLFNI